MKKIITTMALIGFVFLAFGQKMEVGTGAYVTQSQGSYITVDGAMVTNGTFTVKSNASGTGSLIITGTGTATTSGDVTVERFLTHDKWHFISGQTNISGNFSTLSMGMTGGTTGDQFYRWEEDYTYNNNTGVWVDILNGEDGTGTNTLMDDEGFVVCKGYSINYVTTDKTLSLSGVPYVADKSFTMTKTTSSSAVGANLVGNPFTSTIALNSGAQTTNNLIDKNTSVLATGHKAVYLWDESIGASGDYLTINNSSSATFAEPGQGFMVVANADDDVLNFHKVIQKHNAATFYKAGDEIQRFELLVTNPDGECNKTMVAFLPEMTNGLDESYDARKLHGYHNLALYSLLVDDDGEAYAIQSLPPITDGISVQLGLAVEVLGTYVFEPSLIENFGDDIPISLEDKATGIITDLRKHPSYTCEIFETGVNNERFVLHFKDAVGLEESKPVASNYFYVANNTLYFIDELDGLSTIRMYNLLGQEVFTKQVTDNTGSMSINLPTGYYIVNLTTESLSVNGKVFLK